MSFLIWRARRNSRLSGASWITKKAVCDSDEVAKMKIKMGVMGIKLRALTGGALPA